MPSANRRLYRSCAKVVRRIQTNAKNSLSLVQNYHANDTIAYFLEVQDTQQSLTTDASKLAVLLGHFNRRSHQARGQNASCHDDRCDSAWNFHIDLIQKVNEHSGQLKSILVTLPETDLKLLDIVRRISSQTPSSYRKCIQPKPNRRPWLAGTMPSINPRTKHKSVQQKMRYGNKKPKSPILKPAQPTFPTTHFGPKQHFIKINNPYLHPTTLLHGLQFHATSRKRRKINITSILPRWWYHRWKSRDSVRT